MKKIVSVIILLSGLTVHAQNNPPALNTSLIPPSPDVASLGKFGIQPVTLYSGMPNVSVPVWEIKTTKLDLSISLGYNYNGYRPGEEASSVGLGWTLQAGGVITRIVKGKADDALNVSHKWQDYANILDLSTNPDFLENVAAGNVDTEPDIYIFNFNGHSGKFIMVGNRAFLFPKQDLNIISYGSGSGFYIYSSDGTIYDFHDIETTTPPNSQGNYTPPYTSAWYLSRIISDDWSETINFHYSTWTHHQAGTYSETYTQQNGGSSNVGSGCTIGTCDTWAYNVFPGSWIDAKQLTSITSRSANVYFIPESTSRLDISNSRTAFALKEVDIYNQPDNGLFKKVILSHGYFGGQDQLKLNAVNVWSYHTINPSGVTVIDSLQQPPYTFEYFHEQSSYPKTTKGLDRWGYYNGVNGNFWLFDQTLTGGPLLYAFADRNVYPDFCANGILTKLTYPTGGYTTFEYENNKIRQPGANVDVIENKQSTLTVPHSGGSDPHDSTYLSAYFNIDFAQSVKVNYNRVVDPILYPPQYGTHNFHNLFKLFLLNFDQNGDPLPPNLIYVSPYLHPDLFSDSAMIGLNPGKYMYTVTCDGSSLSATATVNYTITHINGYQGDNGPGMRIKTINSYDNIDNTEPAVSRSYTYGNGGKFISAPGYGSNTVHHHLDCGDYNLYTYTSDNSSPITTLYSDQFYYPIVTEVNSDSTVTGKTVYQYFANQMDAMGVILSSQTDYTVHNNTYDIVKYKQSNYASLDDLFPVINFWGFTSTVSDILDAPHCTTWVIPLSGGVFDTVGRTTLYHITTYALTSRANYLMSTDETNYAPGQTNPLTVHTAYYYDNPAYLNPTKTVVQNSKGDIITSQVKYPLDYNLTGCQPLSSIDATYIAGRNSSSVAYQSCKSSRYNAALPYYNPGIPNNLNQPLLNVLRAWKCEENYPTNYAPVLNQMSNSSTSVYNCYDPAFHPDAEAAIISLQRNNVQTPIEQIVSINKNGVEYLQSATKTDYTLYVNNGIYGANPKTVSQTNFLQTPIQKSTFLANPGNYYLPRVDFKYNTSGNIIEQSKTNDVKEAYVWDYNNLHAVAKVINADAANVAATSFESNGNGNFTFSGTPAVDPSAITGKQSYTLSNGAISKTGLDATKTYIVSYWSNNGAKGVNGTNATSGRSLNGFTYYEHKVVNPTGGSITISGSGKIDELRLYPEKAFMTTYTYELLTGISSQCDANNKISYYIYDALGRVHLIRDQDKNIIKEFCYNYAGQPVNCGTQTTYYNVALSQTFTRNDCGKGFIGSTVTYTVSAGIYTSYISQGDADQQAQSDIDANGQNYANTNGTCTIGGGGCSSICRGADKKCINGICETGVKVYTGSRFNGTNYTCVYHYEFSDGSWSATYSETSNSPCD